MQRAIIEPYCNKNKISYSSYEFENEHMDWQPGLEYYIKERPDGIVLCSMYSLTDDPIRRSELLNLALDYGVELHFANELCSLKSKDDLNKIETYLNFAVPKKGPQVWEEGWTA
jgi:sporadic carbohydrate cluster protein (TIGR04323 family)